MNTQEVEVTPRGGGWGGGVHGGIGRFEGQVN